jgi:putative ABC transport system permease protein
MRLFVARGLKLAVFGMLLGLAASSGLMQLIERLLFGVRPLDPLTLTVVTVLLLLTALFACYVPAYRASRADPKVALRYE